MKKYTQLKIILICFCALNFQICFALNKPNCFKKFLLAFYDAGFLYSVTTKEGVDKDFAFELKKRSGCQFDSIVMPRVRIWKEIEMGTIDIAFGGIRSAERDKFTYFIPYFKEKKLAIIRKDAKVKTLKEFITNKNLKFGIISSYQHGEANEEIIKKLRIQGRVQESPNVEQIYLKLSENHIQAIFSPLRTYKPMLKKNKMESSVHIINWTPQEKPVIHSLILAKKVFNNSDVEKWGKIVDDIRSDGTLKRIFRKYLSESETNEMLD